MNRKAFIFLAAAVVVFAVALTLQRDPRHSLAPAIAHAKPRVGHEEMLTSSMNLDALFDDVAKFLETRGAIIDRHDGTKLSQRELDELEQALGLPLPIEYREYLAKVGDGFSFRYWWRWSPDADSDLFGWGLSYVDDVKIERESAKDILDAIISGRGHEYGYNIVSSEEVKAARQRLHWLPIYGIGGGGTSLASIRLVRPLLLSTKTLFATQLHLSNPR